MLFLTQNLNITFFSIILGYIKALKSQNLSLLVPTLKFKKSRRAIFFWSLKFTWQVNFFRSLADSEVLNLDRFWLNETILKLSIFDQFYEYFLYFSVKNVRDSLGIVWGIWGRGDFFWRLWRVRRYDVVNTVSICEITV